MSKSFGCLHLLPSRKHLKCVFYHIMCCVQCFKNCKNTSEKQEKKSKKILTSAGSAQAALRISERNSWGALTWRETPAYPLL